jgi:hypothetical protein
LLLQKLEAKTGIPKLQLFLGGYAFRPAHVRWSDVRSATLAASLHVRMFRFPVADEWLSTPCQSGALAVAIAAVLRAWCS